MPRDFTTKTAIPAIKSTAPPAAQIAITTVSFLESDGESGAAFGADPIHLTLDAPKSVAAEVGFAAIRDWRLAASLPSVKLSSYETVPVVEP